MEALAQLDLRLDRETLRGARSLCPGRARATRLSVLAESLTYPLSDHAAALREALAAIANSLLFHFPDNLFWDFDALCTQLGAEILAGKSAAAAVAPYLKLHHTFSDATPIGFAYGHDFYYGFDWAKWVKKSPRERSGCGAYSAEFLHALQARGGELLSTIERQEDPLYPQLIGSEPRNPFPFSRDPSDEVQLLEAMAARDLLPLRAWEPRASGTWEPDYQRLRAELATSLGLDTPRDARGRP